MSLLALSFRTRILLVVLAVAMVPLILLGLWLTGQSIRSGETLLRQRLGTMLEESAGTVQQRWIPLRSSLLDFVEREEVRAALQGGTGQRPVAAGLTTSLQADFRQLNGAVVAVTIRDADGRQLWSFERREAGPAAAFGAPLTVRIPIYAVDGRTIGTLEAAIRLQALQGSSDVASITGGVVSARDPETGAVLLPVPFDPALVGRERFRWNEQVWVSRTREVMEPHVILVSAAPVARFIRPFQQEARRSLWILGAITGLGLLAVIALTGRLTASLRRLAAAADRIAEGDLAGRIEVGGADEVGRVARAFNAMAASLRRTLRQLAERESLTAVNEFAGSLAHEVRNPLTSMQLDLQEVAERLPPGSELQQLQQQAVEKLRRLDRVIDGALETARSGRVDPREVDLLEPIRSAVELAGPHFEEKGTELAGPQADEPIVCRVDPDALAQVFLNLLLNAAEAVEETGVVELEVEEDFDEVIVRVRDEGHGIPEEDLSRIFDPFFTTRAGGTGLGLAVARRIVRAHRGEIHVRSDLDHGTCVTVRLPRVGPGASSG